MKHKYVYAILLVIIFLLMLFANKLIEEKKDLEQVLEQCSDRYYEKVK